MPRHLIVNADDLGLSPATNLAIERAFRDGIVTSASLMTNMGACDHAVDCIVRRNPELGIGLHLCLTSGRPALAPTEVPLLVGTDGMFRHGFFGLLRLVRSRRREALDQIARELTAQSARIEALGLTIDHVNGHQHVHMIPGVFAIAARIARRYGAPLRIPAAGRPRPRLPILRRLQSALGAGMLKVALLSILSRQAQRSGEEYTAADHCLGVAESGAMSLPILQHLLRGLPPGISEIFVHPGMPAALEPAAVCSPVDRLFLESSRRADELAAVTAPALRTLLADRGITLTNFRNARTQLTTYNTQPASLGQPSRHAA